MLLHMHKLVKVYVCMNVLNIRDHPMCISVWLRHVAVKIYFSEMKRSECRSGTMTDWLNADLESVTDSPHQQSPVLAEQSGCLCDRWGTPHPPVSQNCLLGTTLPAQAAPSANTETGHTQHSNIPQKHWNRPHTTLKQAHTQHSSMP